MAKVSTSPNKWWHFVTKQAPQTKAKAKAKANAKLNDMMMMMKNNIGYYKSERWQIGQSKRELWFAHQ